MRRNTTKPRRRRVRAPEGTPPGFPYPCEDELIGQRVSGRDFAGTVIGCATPPEGKRGRFLFVGGNQVTRGRVARASSDSARARADLTARWEGADHEPPASAPRSARRTRRAPASSALPPGIRGLLPAPSPLQGPSVPPLPPGFEWTARPSSPGFGPGPIEPKRAPTPARSCHGLNLHRQIKYTDDQTLYLELSEFSNSKAWAAQLVPGPVHFGAFDEHRGALDFTLRFLDGFRHKSSSGRTGYSEFDLSGEPDGVYVAESVWRSGRPFRVYFRLARGCVVEHSESLREARGWLGLTENLAELTERMRAEEAARAAQAAEQLRLPTLKAQSDKQRDFAAKIRNDFVTWFRSEPSLGPLWPAVVLETSARVWLDRIRGANRDEALGVLVAAWAAQDPTAAGQAAGVSAAEDEITRVMGRPDADTAGAERLRRSYAAVRDDGEVTSDRWERRLERLVLGLNRETLATVREAFVGTFLEHLARRAGEYGIFLTRENPARRRARR